LGEASTNFRKLWNFGKSGWKMYDLGRDDFEHFGKSGLTIWEAPQFGSGALSRKQPIGNRPKSGWNERLAK
jgi:hypothetical protein